MDDDPPPGVPEWVVTYGDMMSLLLTFFIMLVSMSEVVAEQRFRAVLASLANYMGYPAAAASPPGQHFPLNSETPNLDSLGAFVNDEKGFGGLKRDSLDGPDLRTHRNREGRAVPAGTILFAERSAELVTAGQYQADRIADQLGGKPHKINVIGYAPTALFRDATSEKTESAADGRRPPVEAPRPETGALPGRSEGPAATEPAAATEKSAATGPAAEGLRLAYLRAKAVALRLEADGIAHERLRITVLTVPPAADGVGSESRLPPDRVDVIALDEFSRDLRGPRAE